MSLCLHNVFIQGSKRPARSMGGGDSKGEVEPRACLTSVRGPSIVVTRPPSLQHLSRGPGGAIRPELSHGVHTCSLGQGRGCDQAEPAPPRVVREETGGQAVGNSGPALSSGLSGDIATNSGKSPFPCSLLAKLASVSPPARRPA